MIYFEMVVLMALISIVSGFVLLSENSRYALMAGLISGVAIFIWVQIWFGLSFLTSEAIQNIDPSSFTASGVFWVNMSLAAASWLPLAIAVWLVPAAATPKVYRILAALTWSVGLIFPFLGKEGSWPNESRALGCGVMILTIALGWLQGQGTKIFSKEPLA